MIRRVALFVSMVVPSPASCEVVLGRIDEDGETGSEATSGPDETGAGETGDPCELDPHTCTPAVCGNGIVEADEECDGGPCCQTCELVADTKICGVEVQTELGCPWGSEAGSAVGERARHRYCSGDSPACDGELLWSSWQQVEVCVGTDGCLEDLQACGCPELDPWTPSVAGDVDPEGTQIWGGIPTPLETQITVEFSASQPAGELRVRVCKEDQATPNLLYSVHLRVINALDQPMFEGELAPNGSPCSNYAELEHDQDIGEGELPVGSWWMVSPSTSAFEWLPDCTPAIPIDPTGSCWWSSTLPALTRTCAP